MRDIKTEGFVLKQIPYQNENSKLFSVFTKDFGKITLSARASKKIQSSMRALSPLNICEIEIYKSSNGYFKAKKVTLKKSFIETKELETLQALYTIAEIIHTVTEENHPDSKLYSLIINSALIMQHSEGGLIFETFKTKFLQSSGTLPNLKYCFTCREKRNDDMNWITHDDTHIYCNQCRKKLMTNSKCSQTSLNSLKLLHFIADASFEEILKIKASERAITELAHLNELLIEQLLPKKLHTKTNSLISSI